MLAYELWLNKYTRHYIDQAGAIKTNSIFFVTHNSRFWLFPLHLQILQVFVNCVSNE